MLWHSECYRLPGAWSGGMSALGIGWSGKRWALQETVYGWQFAFYILVCILYLYFSTAQRTWSWWVPADLCCCKWSKKNIHSSNTEVHWVIEKVWVLELHAMHVANSVLHRFVTEPVWAAVFSMIHGMMYISKDGLENEMKEKEWEIRESSAQICKIGSLFISCKPTLEAPVGQPGRKVHLIVFSWVPFPPKVMPQAGSSREPTPGRWPSRILA